MEIRQANMEDLDKVCEIISKLDFNNFKPSSKNLVKKQILDKNYYVAEEGNIIFGAICIAIADQSAEIYSIVSERKGVGKTLIDYAEKICKNKGVPKLWAWSLKFYNAKGFYSRLGFEEQFLLKKQWFNEDCYFFGKLIS